ncbi:MAG: rhodanese-like domain-containing protein [Pyrinomonadaceae bacterium]
MYKIISFYNFFELSDLHGIRRAVRDLMIGFDVLGTVILATEGFNATVCGKPGDIDKFVMALQSVLGTDIAYKQSFDAECPFQKVKVKIKPEIVTLKRNVDMSLGTGTYVEPENWNEIIGNGDVFVLDARNSYEFRTGAFKGAVNPGTSKFSDLPEFVTAELDPKKHRNVAMYCTGGIRCEKFAPYLRGLGFENIYQLNGGILRYLEEVPENGNWFEGECFVFDNRVAVDTDLKKGMLPDLSRLDPR